MTDDDYSIDRPMDDDNNSFSAMHREMQNSVAETWERLQEFYSSKATVVFSTASTCARKSLKSFALSYVLMEEASQMSESTCIIPIMSSYRSVDRIIMSGDTNPSPSLPWSCYLLSERILPLPRIAREALIEKYVLLCRLSCVCYGQPKKSGH